MKREFPARLSLLLLAALVNFGLFGQFIPSNSPDVQFNWQGTTRLNDFLFMGVMRSFTPSPRRPTHMLFDAEGDLIWYLQANDWIYDFKAQKDGRLTYSDNRAWRVLDSNFAIVDSFRCDGYYTDIHDFILREDNHAFLVCGQDSIADLSTLMTPSGQPGNQNGRLDGIVIQEFDENHQLVKEWNTWDYYGIADADTVFFVNANRLDLNHTNSIDIDDNGHMLISHRNISEVTLIDWASGDILWQLGGKNNNFDRQGDPGTSAQHMARFLPNNRISVFDNGTSRHAPRGLIYALDTLNWVASIEKEYEIGTTFSEGMGSFQYFDDGTALMGLGNFSTVSIPHVYYYDSNGDEALNITFQSSFQTYRAQMGSLNFEPKRPEIQCQVQNGDIVLGLADSYSAYLWTTDATTAEIVVGDTGWYHVYVPQGVGMLASQKVYVSDLTQGCDAVVSSQEAATGTIRPAKLIGLFDILGRPIFQAATGQLVIERYDNGQQRKVIYVE